jgi:serine/threonine protein kinase
MEYCEGGDMKKLISQAIGEQKAVFFLRQIISALKILKENKVVHRDLKPANILITGDSIIKIADFGLARTIDPESLAKTFAGTLAYMAPEVFDAKINNERYDYRADIWSVGCILYELITGIKPFNPPDVSRIKTSINSSLKSADFLNSPEFSLSCKDFLKKIFQIDPNNRINFEEFCNHELVTGIPTLAEFNDCSLPCFEMFPKMCEEKEALEFAETVIKVEEIVRYPFVLYMKACELLRPFLYNEVCKQHFKHQYESARKLKNMRNWHRTSFVEVALETAVLLCQGAEKENKKKALVLLRFVGNNSRVLAFREAIESDLDRDL